jgi:predicted amidohydrolase
MLTIGIVQMQSIPLKIDRNLECAGRLIAQVCEKDAQLVVLPEFFSEASQA